MSLWRDRLVNPDIRQLGAVGAVASFALSRAVAASAGAAAFVLEGAHQSPDGKAHCHRHYRQCYDCLYHNQINKLPIWKKSVDTIQARPMV